MTDGGEWLQDLGGRERGMLEKEGAGEGGGTLGKGIGAPGRCPFQNIKKH